MMNMKAKWMGGWACGMGVGLAVCAICAAWVCAAEPVILIPLPTQGTNAGWWVSDPTGTNAVTARQAWQAVNTNFARVDARLGAIADGLRTNSVVMSGMTISNATASTWGVGAGIVCVDADFVYVSTGTNAWKRAAISGW